MIGRVGEMQKTLAAVMLVLAMPASAESRIEIPELRIDCRHTDCRVSNVRAACMVRDSIGGVTTIYGVRECSRFIGKKIIWRSSGKVVPANIVKSTKTSVF